MCGRYSLAPDAKQLAMAFPGFDLIAQLTPRYNIAPTQPMAVLLDDGRPRMEIVQWGLIPPWAKDPAIGARMINARSETVHEKPAFREAFRRKRCLVPADGYYEWQAAPAGGKKQPMRFRMTDERPFAMAGLWEEWHDRDGGLILSATILTTNANRLARPIHDRMPVILPAEAWPVWLSRNESRPERLQPWLRPYPPDRMEVFPVTPRVGRTDFDQPLCLEPLAEPPLQQGELF